VKENLNDYIKHREWFRPFAVAVAEEDCERYFERSQLCQSMKLIGLGQAGGKRIAGRFRATWQSGASAGGARAKQSSVLAAP